MILTIDIGNSNIVLGGVREEEIVFEARLRTDATKTSDQYCVDLKILMDVYDVKAEDIEGIIIASVVPQVLNSLQTAQQHQFVFLAVKVFSAITESGGPCLQHVHLGLPAPMAWASLCCDALGCRFALHLVHPWQTRSLLHIPQLLAPPPDLRHLLHPLP